MDYQFPSQLFPGFYNRGPPDSVFQHSAGNWGSYDRVLPVGGTGDLSSWTFTSQHQVKGEAWSPTEPTAVPLLSPKHAVSWPLTPPDPMDFVEHMQNFYTDYHQEAFGCMAEILGHDFNFQKKKYQLYSASIKRMRRFMDMMRFKKCELAYSSQTKDAYSRVLTDVMHTIPPELLSSLLHEELTEQRDRMLNSQGTTGGALAFVPFSDSGSSSSQRGCLLYPGKEGLDSLNFHIVALHHQRGGPSGVSAETSDLFSFQLKGPIRQISTASLFNHCCVAVRSDHLCGVWRFSESDKPRLLQVINTTEVATCISASPHILGEVLVASEGGAAVLWTVARGIEKIREDEENLYFNAKSSWRWCEFAAHPRVMLYADRTGAELTDIREKPATTHTLFQINNTSACRSGERLSLCQYLGLAHPFHHLITTQYSAYIMDERFAAMPMIKLDHMLQSTPIFCHVVPGSDSSGSLEGGSKTTKVLLGSHSSQEIMMLQYSGGRAEASLSRGPPRSLHRPKDSLKQLPVQIPHRLVFAENRLSSPALGLTCMHKTGSGEEECMCVLQLTEAGDIFYQILQPEARQSQVPAAPVAPGGAPQMEHRASNTDSCFSHELEMKAEACQPSVSGPRSTQSDEAGAASRPDTDTGGGEARSVEGRICDRAEAELSSSSLSTWKRWLVKLMRRRPRTELGPGASQHMLVNSTGLLHHCSRAVVEDPSEKECMERLRQELSTSMSERSLLVCSTVSASLGPSEPAPLPNPVETDAWEDDLSQRLTASWQGEDAWRSWWSEKLGLDRERKVEDLRRRRRREKEARRAARRRLELSDSFSSSASCLSGWNDLWDSPGCVSAASQAAWSDSESIKSQRSQETSGSPVLATAARDKQSSQKNPSTSCPPVVSQTPTVTSTTKRSIDTLDSYLSSLLPPQDDDSAFQDDGHTKPVRSLAASFPLHSSQRPSQDVPRVDLSQDRLGLSSLPESQSSQSRLGRSQSSQPQRRSQMGF